MMNDHLEQLVSAAEAEGWQICTDASATRLWYKFPIRQHPDERPDAIKALNIALREPAMRSAIIPHLVATGRTA